MREAKVEARVGEDAGSASGWDGSAGEWSGVPLWPPIVEFRQFSVAQPML